LLAAIRRRMSQELRTWSDVEDVFQESALRALGALRDVRLSTPAEFRSWFMAIAAHRIQEIARERRTRACHVLDDAARDERATGDPDRPPTERLGRVARELKQLRASQRLSLLLRDHHGLGWDTIGFMIGQPSRPSTRQLHFRARRSLAALLTRRR
jgi:DNA-directed RNA polymerase specialized sigma24 family protein